MFDSIPKFKKIPKLGVPTLPGLNPDPRKAQKWPKFGVDSAIFFDFVLSHHQINVPI